MTSSLSQVGTQMSNLSGVRAIMKDIIATLAADKDREWIDLSAGNPVILPEIEQMWRDYTIELLASEEYGQVVCRYGSSQGYQPLIASVAEDFNRRYGLNLTPKQILITPGSQSLYFYAVNAFGGTTAAGQTKQVVLPLSPDYTGYGGMSIVPDSVIAYQPTLDIDRSAHRFKYRPNFDRLKIDRDTGCVLFSRPCNPTGNIVTDEEVEKIAKLAANYDVPVAIDSAYAPPFPGLNFCEMTPLFADNIIHCMSLSKAGLPGERIGIAIGSEKYISILESFQTNACIHSSRYGQAIAAKSIASGKLAALSESVIRPYYQHKFTVLEDALNKFMPANLPWYLHRGEGAIFGWLWFEDLPTSDWELYQTLKQVGVIVVPGNSFFPGLRSTWQHKHECIRISLTAGDTEIVTAIERLAEVVSRIYARSD
jgi:valine--pyruvate aminotransferase